MFRPYLYDNFLFPMIFLFIFQSSFRRLLILQYLNISSPDHFTDLCYNFLPNMSSLITAALFAISPAPI